MGWLRRSTIRLAGTMSSISWRRRPADALCMVAMTWTRRLERRYVMVRALHADLSAADTSIGSGQVLQNSGHGRSAGAYGYNARGVLPAEWAGPGRSGEAVPAIGLGSDLG